MGYRKLTAILRREGHPVNTKRIRRLMAVMGLQAVYCRRTPFKPHPEHRVYPYLLKGLSITGPNQVWATDITYIRLRQRHVRTWWPSWIGTAATCTGLAIIPTMEVGFVLQALEEALSQGPVFSTVIKAVNSHLRLSPVDWKLRALPSVWTDAGLSRQHFTECLWRSVKYEEVYLKNTGISSMPRPASAPM